MRSALAVGLAAASLALAQTPGPQVLTFYSSVDDSDQPYALFLPYRFDPSRRYPLVMSLHGGGSNHRLNLKRVFGKGNLAGETEAEASRRFPRFRDVEFIVASPFARGSMGYEGIPEQDVYDVMADVKRRFSIDEDRVFLTGLSMGGAGTLWLGLTRPDLWAAIAPVCPAVRSAEAALFAPNALNLPVRLFQGDQDPVVPVAKTRLWHKRLLEFGAAAEYVEYPGVRHNSWDYAYRDGAIFDWFTKFSRDPQPPRVRFVSSAYRYRTAYWVELDALTPGTPAEIDVRFTARNRIEAATRNLHGFTLHLERHPQFASGRPVAVTIDGTAVKVKPAPALSFARNEKGWRAGRALLEPKRPGAEGPIPAAVSGRHIYVYGTADSPSEEEVRRRHEVALKAAEWSGPQGRLSLALHVRADREVKDHDLDSASLVLFGTSGTNRVIARMADRLPLALNPGAADYGLAFVAPAGNNYVVVSSGLPWWTGADDVERGGHPRLATPARILSTLGDFILFKGSLANVVAEGRFDRNWKTPKAAADLMAASGTVTIR